MACKHAVWATVLIVSASAVCQLSWADNPPPGGSAVNTQVRGEVYGNNKQRQQMYSPQVAPLPSETRMAIRRSGALPSEIQMNARLAGPLPEYGALSYIPFESPLQHAMKAPPPNLWGPAWQKNDRPAPPPGPVQPPNLAQNADAAKRAQAAQTPSLHQVAPIQFQPGPIQAGHIITGQPTSTAQPGTTNRRIAPATEPSDH